MNMKKIFLFSFVMFAFLFLAQHEAQATSRPIGYLDVITDQGVIKGWALDPDRPATALEIHAYFDGKAGVSTKVVGTVTSFARCDVQYTPGDCSYGYGYEIIVPQEFRDNKQHTVYVYALGVDSNGVQNGKNDLLKGSPKTFTINSSVAVNRPPIGYLDGVGDDLRIKGWAIDPDNTYADLEVHIYFDGPAGVSKAAIADKAQYLRDDVNRATGHNGNHGFDITVPSEFLDGNNHTIYAYGIDTTDTSGRSNKLLSGSPKSFSFGVPATPAIPEPAPEPVVTSVDPLVLVTTSIPQISQGAEFIYQLEASGGLAPLIWSVEEGTTYPLDYISLDANTGIFRTAEGSTGLDGVWQLFIRVTDAQGTIAENIFYWEVK
jgi:hypothetical protein